MNLSFEPNVGADPLWFGMSRDHVRSILNQLSDLHDRWDSRLQKYTDGVILDFNSKDQLNYMEVTEPSSAVLGEIEFFIDELEIVVERLQELDENLYREPGCYFAPTIGVGLYAPQGLILSASLFLPGYYDKI